MSKDKSKKWVISAPLFYNYARIPRAEILGSIPRMTKKVKSGDDTRLREF